jgi:hypothetical protein
MTQPETNGDLIIVSAVSGTADIQLEPVILYTQALNPEVDLTHILGHLLTTTGTQLADAFEKFFDVATPTGTANSLPDAIPGAAGGLLKTDLGRD